MRRIQLGALALLAFLSTRSWLSARHWAGPPDDAIAAYKTADYNRAIPLLEAAVSSTSKDPILRADLLSALVYEGRVDEDSEAVDADAAEFPQSPEVTAARGEFAFYMSDTFEAERLFKQALRLKDDSARGTFGLSRLYRAASSSRTMSLRLIFRSVRCTMRRSRSGPTIRKGTIGSFRQAKLPLRRSSAMVPNSSFQRS